MGDNIVTSFSGVDCQRVPLDIKLRKILPFNDGFYVEAGANDGITQSNTAMFEKYYGWKGLLIDPSTVALKKCIENRSKSNIFENCALVSSDDISEIEGDFEEGYLMASVDGKRMNKTNLIKIKAHTLRNLVNKYNINRIDFMSLDVEGYELEVLKGIDLDKDWAPKIFLIEIYKDQLDQIRNILKPYYNIEYNFTNYNKVDNPGWDGTHNDYLFIRKDYTC